MRYSIKHRCADKALKQQGAVLIVSLIILMLMTLIGVTSLRTTTFEERMAGNTRDRMLAFESAEAGLRFAEDYIDTNIVTLGDFDANGADGLYSNVTAYEHIWRIVDWSGTASGNTNKAISATVAMDGIKTPPKFVLQHYAAIALDEDKTNLTNYGQGIGAGEVQMFRITVRGTGGSDNSVAILQSTYGKLL